MRKSQIQSLLKFWTRAVQGTWLWCLAGLSFRWISQQLLQMSFSCKSSHSMINLTEICLSLIGQLPVSLVLGSRSNLSSIILCTFHQGLSTTLSWWNSWSQACLEMAKIVCLNSILRAWWVNKCLQVTQPRTSWARVSRLKPSWTTCYTPPSASRSLFMVQELWSTWLACLILSSSSSTSQCSASSFQPIPASSSAWSCPSSCLTFWRTTTRSVNYFHLMKPSS